MIPKPKTKRVPFNQSGSLLHEGCHTLTARIALLSNNNNNNSKDSIAYDLILLAIEYTQLLLPTIIFSISFTTHQEAIFSDITIKFLKLMNPSYWVGFPETNLSALYITIIMALLLVSKIALYGYIIYLAFQKTEDHHQDFWVKIWRHVFKIQTRFLYYFLTSFVINAVFLEGIDKGLKITGSILIILEFVFSLLLNITYSYILPTQNLLSAKSNILEITTITQKLIIQILTTFLSTSPNSHSLLFLAIINISFDLFRNVYFFKTLPLYLFQALSYQAVLLSVVTSLNLSVLILTIIDQLRGIIVLWVVFLVLTVKLSTAFIKISFLDIILNPRLNSPALAVHKIEAIKELRTLIKEYSEGNERYSWSLLVSKTFTSNIEKIMRIDETFSPSQKDIHCENSANQMFDFYLQKLLDDQFPKNKFILIFRAQFHVKTLHVYTHAIEILQKLQEENFSSTSLAASALLYEIQNIIKIDYSHSKQLDLSTFFQNRLLFEQTKAQMLHQANLQLSISHEIKKEAPFLGHIFSQAQKFRLCQKNLVRETEPLLDKISSAYLEPVLLYAGYYLTLNHSIENYIRYSKLYAQRLQIHQKIFSQDHLVNENLTQDNVGFFIVTADSISPGFVVYASKALEQIFGGNSSLYSGRPLASFGAPCMREIYADFHKTRKEDSDGFFVGNVMQVFAYNPAGYMIEAEFYMDVCPIIAQGVYWAMMVRPVESKKEFLYVLEDGKLDTATKDLTKKLGLNNEIDPLKDPEYYINEISEELEIANEAFNVIAFPEKYNQTTIEKAQEIYDIYTTTGKDLQISPVNQPDKSLSFKYNCKIMSKAFGKTLLKLISFEEIILHEDMKKRSPSPRKTTFTNKNLVPLITVEEPDRFKTQEEEEEGEYTEDQREYGWVRNLDTLSPIRQAPTFPTKEGETLITENNNNYKERLLIGSPRATEESSHRAFLSNKNSTTRSFQTPFTPSNKCYHNSEDDRRREKILKQKHKDDLIAIKEKKIPKSIMNDSKFSQQKKLAHIYKNALDEKYFSKDSKVFLLTIILVFIALFASQISMKTTLDTDMKALEIKKDVLRDSQQRNFYLLTLQACQRLLWDAKTGSITPADFGPVSFALAVVPRLAQQSIEGLSETNQNLLANASSLAKNNRDMFFAQNVEIIFPTSQGPSNQDFPYIDTFQAVDLIIQSSLKISQENDVTSQTAIDNANFLFYNTLNDLIIKSESLSDALTVALSNQHPKVKHGVVINTVTGSFVSIGFIVVFLFILRRQYKKQAVKVATVTRFSPAKLDLIIRSFDQFKAVLEKPDSIKISLLYSTLDLWKNQSKIKKEATRKEDNKTPVYTGLRRIYYIQIIKLTILMLIIMATQLFASVYNLNCLKFLEVKQTQIYFADFSATRLSLAWSAAQELLNTNNTAFILEKPADRALREMLEGFKEIRETAYDLDFREDQGGNNDLFHNLIFEDSCSLIPDIEIFCGVLNSQGRKSSLIGLLYDFEENLREQLEEYTLSDKSANSLKKIDKNLAYVLLDYIFIVYIFQSLSDYLDISYEDVVSEAEDSRKIVLALFAVGFFVVFLMFWRLIYVKIRDGINQTKNILRVFPADLVLSSFILKNFLAKSSNGTLDALKNDA